MISVEIEKEINQENKVIMDLNLRQFVCLIILAISSIIIVAIMGMEGNISLYPISAVAALLFAFGWYKPNGLPFEKYAMKQLQTMLYGSNVRKYKTKNQYVVMVNDEYKRRKNIDMADPRLKKQIEKEQKQAEKMLQKAEKTSVCKPVQ